MSPLTLLERLLWYGTIAGYAILLTKLLATKLYRVYRLFGVYLAFRVLRAAALLPFHPNTNPYAWIWILTEPLLLFLYVLVSLEVYGLILRDYPGIASLGRWVMLGGLTVAVVLSAVSLRLDLALQNDPYPTLTLIHVARRGVVSSLIVFWLLIIVFLSFYPVPLRRNVVLHSVIYCVYFLSATLVIFIRNVIGYSVTRTMSLSLLAVNAACLAAWIALLNRGGEERPITLRRRVPVPGGEDRLLAHMDALNTTLTRAARK